MLILKHTKEKGVIYCNMREKPFYESMPTEPEVVLAEFDSNLSSAAFCPATNRDIMNCLK